MRKKIYIYISLVVTMFLLVGVTYAAFTDKGEVLGSSFSISSSDIKFLESVTGGIESTNLLDQLPGPDFYNITPQWYSPYFVKIYNNGTKTISLTSHANYDTANDPEELRQIVSVTPTVWEDMDNNGFCDPGEERRTLEKKTIVKWKTEGYDFGQLDPGKVIGLRLNFTTEEIADSKQGATAAFDFIFDSIQVE